MSTRPFFVVSFPKLLTSWLTAGDGGYVAASLTLLLDDFRARGKLALLARFPDFAPDDAALAAMGRDRIIRRGIDEPSAAFAVRLKRALDDHKKRGTPYALLAQLQAYLQTPCVVRIVDRRGNWYSIDADGNKSSSIDSGNWDWDGGALTSWSRFWVVIYPADSVDPWPVADDWGVGTWGDESTLSFGVDSTTAQVAAVRGIVREWKPAGTVCEWIIVAFDAATFTPAGATNPGGAWGNWSNGAGAPVRLASARYWKGS
jgi:hypothetical protein